MTEPPFKYYNIYTLLQAIGVRLNNGARTCRRLTMFCKNCGHQIDDRAIVCPNCGIPTDNFYAANGSQQNGAPNTPYAQQPYAHNYYTPAPSTTNGLAIAGFVLSILSLWLGALFAVISIIALVLSILGFKKSPIYKSGKGLSVAGIIISAISCALWVFYWLIIFMLALMY